MLKKKEQMRWIDNVPVLIYGMRKEISVIGAFESALSVMKRPYSYEDLMAFSSMGLTTKWFKGEGAIWGGDVLPGIFNDEIELISKAIGYECIIKSGNDQKQECKQAIVESIDREIPVLCLDRGLNLAVAFGYDDGGDKIIIRPYIDSCISEEGWDAAVKYKFDDLLPFFIFLKESVEPIDRIEAITNGIKIGCASFNKQQVEYNDVFYNKGIYYYGKAAYDKWIEDLRNIDMYSDDEKGSLKFFTWWNTVSIIDRRVTIVKVFRDLASNPYKTDTINKYIEAARICTKQNILLDKMIIDNKYDSSIEDWIKHVPNDILILEESKNLEQELCNLLESITDMKDI